MRFLKRHQYSLVVLGVLALSSVLVVRQYLVNQWEHVDLREDFILLHDEGHARSTERLYQMLVQELPRLPDRALVEDDQRLALLVAQEHPSSDDLIWKYHTSVRNELQRRTDQRVARALRRAGIE